MYMQGWGSSANEAAGYTNPKIWGFLKYEMNPINGLMDSNTTQGFTVYGYRALLKTN